MWISELDLWVDHGWVLLLRDCRMERFLLLRHLPAAGQGRAFESVHLLIALEHTPLDLRPNASEWPHLTSHSCGERPRSRAHDSAGRQSSGSTIADCSQ